MNSPALHGIRVHPPSGSTTSPVPEKLTELLTGFYHLGEITAYQRVSRGQVNTGHVVETILDQKRSKYFIRQYHPDRKIAEIEFEHALINHLVAKKFEYVGRVIQTTTGQTYVQLPMDRDGSGPVGIFAVFDFLSGNVQYDWTPPLCDHHALESAAETLARYHRAVADWQPVNGWARPGIVEQLAHTEAQLQAYCHDAGDTPFDVSLLDHLDLISQTNGSVLRALRTPMYGQLPRLAIHGDFHPGNLTFQQGRVSGLFDFDWARMDVRCFDVALSIFYFCVQWQEGVDGQLDTDRAAAFLQAYQNTLRGKPGIGALNNIEQRFLGDMILAADIYVLGWILSDFYTGPVDVNQHTDYLRHGLNYLRWADENNSQRLWHDIIGNGDLA